MRAKFRGRQISRSDVVVSDYEIRRDVRQTAEPPAPGSTETGPTSWVE